MSEAFEPPKAFDAPEGRYVLQEQPAFASQRQGRTEHIDCAAVPVRVSVCSIKQEGGSAAELAIPSGTQAGEQQPATASMTVSPGEALHSVFNTRKAVFWHINCAQRSTFAYPHHSPVTHDINAITRSSANIEVLVGFTSGEIVLREMHKPTEAARWFNEQSKMVDSPVTVVKWIPGSESRFIAAFENGALLVFEKEFLSEAKIEGSMPSSSKQKSGCVVIPQSAARTNPIMEWHFPKRPPQAIYALSFSPDCVHLAIVGRDGLLRVIDFNEKRVVFERPSYFGALYCVAWSPDGHYILTGGQDDLVSVWSFHEQDIAARAQGHASWVMAVAFDPYPSDSVTYRFGSVGQDARLCLWDFSSTGLRPRKLTVSQPVNSPSSPGFHLRRKKKKSAKAISEKAAEADAQVPKGKNEVATLVPLVSTRLHGEPMSDIVFREEHIITACQAGELKIWRRPPKVHFSAV